MEICGENRLLTAIDKQVTRNLAKHRPILVVGYDTTVYPDGRDHVAPTDTPPTPGAYYIPNNISWTDLAGTYANLNCTCDIGDDVYLRDNGARTTDLWDPLATDDDVYRATGECTAEPTTYTPPYFDGCLPRTTGPPHFVAGAGGLVATVGITKDTSDTWSAGTTAATINSGKERVCRAKEILPTSALPNLCPTDYLMVNRGSGWHCEVWDIVPSTITTTVAPSEPAPSVVTVGHYGGTHGDTAACTNGFTAQDASLTFSATDCKSPQVMNTIGTISTQQTVYDARDPFSCDNYGARLTATQGVRCTNDGSKLEYNPYGNWDRSFGTLAASKTSIAEINLAGHCSSDNQAEITGTQPACAIGTQVPAQDVGERLEPSRKGDWTSMHGCVIGRPDLSTYQPEGTLKHCLIEGEDTLAWQTTHEQCLAGSALDSTSKLCEYFPMPARPAPTYSASQFTACPTGYTTLDVYHDSTFPDGTTFSTLAGVICYEENDVPVSVMGWYSRGTIVRDWCTSIGGGTPCYDDYMTGSNRNSYVSFPYDTNINSASSNITFNSFAVAGAADDSWLITLPASADNAGVWFHRDADGNRHPNQSTWGCGLGELNRKSKRCYTDDHVLAADFFDPQVPQVEIETPTNTIIYNPRVNTGARTVR